MRVRISGGFTALMLMSCRGAPERPACDGAWWTLHLRGALVAAECRVDAPAAGLWRSERARWWSVSVGGDLVQLAARTTTWHDSEGGLQRAEGSHGGGWEARWAEGELVVRRGGGRVALPSPVAPRVAGPGRVSPGEHWAWNAGKLVAEPVQVAREGVLETWTWPGGAQHFTVDADGALVEERVGPLVARPGTDWPDGRVALLDLVRVPVTIPRDPRGARVLLVRAVGAALPEHGARQRHEGDGLRITAPFAEEVPAVAVADQAPQPTALPDDLLRGVRAARTRRAAVGAGIDAVRAALPHAPRLGAADAVGILAAGAGDCTERAALLVSALGAVGVRARVVGGLLLVGAPEPAAWPHAWVEVWYGDDTGWVGVDPSLGQLEADAGHIVLGLDEAGWGVSLLPALEASRLEVVEVR